MIFLLFNNLPMSIKKTFCDPCIFLVGPRSIHSWVFLVILLVIFGLLYASTYEPNITLHCCLKSNFLPINISLCKYFTYIRFLSCSTSNHIIKKYTKCMMIWADTQEYGNIVMIPLLCPFTILIFLSAYLKCSCTSEVLISTLPNLSAVFSKSMYISITCITKPPRTYNSITL